MKMEDENETRKEKKKKKTQHDKETKINCIRFK